MTMTPETSIAYGIALFVVAVIAVVLLTIVACVGGDKD